MRKALIGLMAAATALTPLAPAAAQNWGGRDSARAERQQQRMERRAERQVQRSERQVQSADRQLHRAERQVQRADRQAQRIDRRSEAAVTRAPRSTNDAAWRQRAERQATREVAATPRVEVAQRSAQWDGRRDGNSQWSGRSRDSQWSGRSRDGNWDRNRSGGSHWNRGWRNDNRYDWQRYRYANRSIYRPGRYYSPYRGHSYTRFYIGFGLDPLFYSSRYWISDPWQYRLPPAYDGTRWVRYYDDVLLVDLYTGEVIDVIYDFFW